MGTIYYAERTATEWGKVRMAFQLNKPDLAPGVADAGALLRAAMADPNCPAKLRKLAAADLRRARCAGR